VKAEEIRQGHSCFCNGIEHLPEKHDDPDKAAKTTSNFLGVGEWEKLGLNDGGQSNDVSELILDEMVDSIKLTL
jgi:hypothetical protein